MAKVTKRIILITGGGSGIGAAMTERFRAMGNMVVICGRDKAKLARAKDDARVRSIVCDVTDPDQCQSMLDKIDEEYGQLDMLVNCAGVMFSYDFDRDLHTSEKIVTEIETNAIAPLRLTYMALPLLKKSKKASIVFVSSGLAYIAFAGTPVYSGTKALLHHSAQVLRHQLADLPISVFELLPPITDTPMAAGMNTGGFKKSSPSDVVDELIAGMESGCYEIAAGDSKKLRFMSRLAPNFLFNRMANAFQ